MLELMAYFKRDEKTALPRIISISGECMSAEQGKIIRAAFPFARIYHVYGLTEACPRVSYLDPSLFDYYPDFVGRPLKSVSIMITDKEGNILPVGEEGLLWVKGNNVMLGYYNNHAKTKEIIKDDWLFTGDIAYMNSVGLLKIKGRADDMIIKAGMNIYPAEIEFEIKKDPRVREVVVFKNDTEMGIQIGMKISGGFSSVDEVRELCKKCLSDYQIPNLIELVDEIPKNGSGKVSRNTNLIKRGE
jgi:acyl-CoA synthetase (AMP-forming)/AMP-acid ligase II